MSSNIPIVNIRNTRLEKVDRMRALGMNPYPSVSKRTHYAEKIFSDFDALEGQTVVVAGRLMSWREHGAISFGHVQDQTGRIQLYVREDTLGPTRADVDAIGYGDLSLLDVGDFVEARGIVTRTKRGEMSILTDTIRLLTKSLRPLPDKWEGLKNREAIIRRRYLDTIIHPENRQPFELIARMTLAIRKFLDGRGFLEFQTPVIQPQYGGGTARPFITHVNALGVDMYLSIAHELYLKRLIAAGYDNVYTIGRYFRNEGIDRNHNPEFSMVETMSAYHNYEYNMDLIEAMFRHVTTEVFGKNTFMVQGHEVDFSKDWQRISMREAVQSVTGIDFGVLESVEAANGALLRLGIDEPQPSIGNALLKAFEEKVEETLIQPTLLYGHPMEISPLAKPMNEDPRCAERFEIFIGGMECGDNWSEQNDPVQLYALWKSQYRPEDRDAGEFHPMDYDFLEVLEYGIPPTTGIGPGIERMAMIFTERDNIDEVLFFPMARPVLSRENAIIYEVEEQVTAPPQEIILSFEQAALLIEAGALAPDGEPATVKPFMQVWQTAGRVMGYAEITGLMHHKRIRITGYTAEVSAEGHEQDLAAFAAFLGSTLYRPLKTQLAGLKLKVDEAAIAIYTG